MILNIPKNITDQLFSGTLYSSHSATMCSSHSATMTDMSNMFSLLSCIFCKSLKTKEWKLSQWWTPASQANVGREDAFEDQVVSDSA